MFNWQKQIIKLPVFLTIHGLDDRGVGVPVPVGARIFLLHVVQTGSGAHPANSMGTGGTFPRDEAVGP
jgi:hypothetical protein